VPGADPVKIGLVEVSADLAAGAFVTLNRFQGREGVIVLLTCAASLRGVAWRDYRPAEIGAISLAPETVRGVVKSFAVMQIEESRRPWLRAREGSALNG
jgi:hypothetical protein